jgi:hypothetical protein
MTEGPGAKDAPPTFPDEERAPGQDWLSDLGEQDRRELLAWVGEHLPHVRQSVYGQRLLYWSWGSPWWLAWPHMSVATCSDRR